MLHTVSYWLLMARKLGMINPITSVYYDDTITTGAASKHQGPVLSGVTPREPGLRTVCLGSGSLSFFLSENCVPEQEIPNIVQSIWAEKSVYSWALICVKDMSEKTYSWHDDLISGYLPM